MHLLRRRAPRVFLVAVASLTLGLTSTSALAAPTTTTTLSPATVLAGNAFVRQLLARQPVPPEARRTVTLPTPLPALSDVGISPSVREAHHEYLLPESVDVTAYVRAHLPKGETINGTGTGSAPNVYPTYSLDLSVSCVSPHITYCGVYYSTTQADDGQQELRIDAQVIWLPILHVEMPTNGVVTVTGYGKSSLMNPSSDPSSVVLSAHQVRLLRMQISRLKDLGDNGMCMEDELLLNINVTKNHKVVWSGVADSCPGGLTITSSKTNAILDNRSCEFWHVVNTFFPKGQATATKKVAKGLCGALRYG